MQPRAYTLYLVFQAAQAFLFSLVFTTSNLYQVSVAHLTPLQLVLIGTTLETSVFLFEIPTGVVADVFSRRLSVIIGVFLIGVGFLIEGSFPIFWAIALAQVFWGVGYTFTSGAQQAWISDEIGEENAAPAFLRGAQVAQIGSLLATVLGTALGLLGLNLPILLGGGLFFLLAAYLIAFMPETGFHPTPAQDRTNFQRMAATFRAGLGVVRRRPDLGSILWIGLFYGLYSEGFDRLWTIHMISRFHFAAVQPVVWFGALRLVGMLLSAAATGWLANKAEHSRPRRLVWVLALASVGLIVGLIIFGASGSLWLAIAAFWAIGVLREVIAPLYTAWVNQRLDSQVRATILSMSSQVDACGQIAGGPLLGLIAQRISVQAGLYGSAVLLTPILGLFARFLLPGQQKKTANPDD